MTNEKIKPPIWFWIVSIVALLWNLMGVLAYLGEAYMSEEAFALLSEGERTLYEARPAWVTGAFAIAVFAGALGCIGLLLRKKWAAMVLVISLLGVIGQQTYLFFMSDTFDVMGNSAMFMPITIIIVAILLIVLARSANKKMWMS